MRAIPLGHEPVGEIAEVGAGVTGLKVNDHVVVNPQAAPSGIIGCGGALGGMPEYLLIENAVVGKSLAVFPDAVPFDVAALNEPMAVARHCVNRSGARPADKVVVFGAGPIGLGATASPPAPDDSHTEVRKRSDPAQGAPGSPRRLMPRSPSRSGRAAIHRPLPSPQKAHARGPNRSSDTVQVMPEAARSGAPGRRGLHAERPIRSRHGDPRPRLGLPPIAADLDGRVLAGIEVTSAPIRQMSCSVADSGPPPNVTYKPHHFPPPYSGRPRPIGPWQRRPKRASPSATRR
jgi:hypothetical protein